MGRRFGGPEIALLAVALAFAVPMTAWWHGLYQQPKAVPKQARFTAPPTQSVKVAEGTRVHTFAATGYLVNVDSTTGEITLPSFATDTYPRWSAPIPETDPNQTLLIVLALLGTVAAGVYTMSVYPALRR